MRNFRRKQKKIIDNYLFYRWNPINPSFYYDEEHHLHITYNNHPNYITMPVKRYSNRYCRFLIHQVQRMQKKARKALLKRGIIHG